tara:strand:- start:917 stop:1438 length:522 start_codon:yes stop_codon:yes gene_type:complete
MGAILVGNGTSVLDEAYGDLIDSFDIVVRFNDFKLDGFREHVGQKTNCWFTCGDYGEQHLEEANKFDRVILHTWEYERNSWVKKFGKKTKFEMTSKSEISKIPVKWPSTGLIAIHWFIKELGYVTIVGFDWWERGAYHYGDDLMTEGDLHEPAEEHKIIKRLIEEQKLNFLSI